MHSENKLLRLLPVMRHVVASFPGISNDISLDGQDEIPTTAFHYKRCRPSPNCGRSSRPICHEWTSPSWCSGVRKTTS